MSEINLNYVVQPTEVSLQVNTNELTFTPEPINFTFSLAGVTAGGNTVPGGTNSHVQFNNNGTFAGAGGLTYDIDTGVTTSVSLIVSGNANIQTLNVSNTSQFSGSTTFLSSTNVANTLSIQQGREKALVSTSTSGTIDLDVTQSGVFNLTTALTGNVTFNFTNLGTLLGGLDANVRSVTIAVITRTGSTVYFPTSIRVGGSTLLITTRWLNGSTPGAGSILANATVAYTFTIIRTSPALNAFTILSSHASFL